ncbi:MAG TPA: hypothetical protein VFA65_24230 [Bryobacteraceae bacterium]|nr:hypothetical protein [Bryobacteraceae bacterium]
MTIILPPDPLPIQFASVEAFTADESSPASTQLAQYAASGASTLYLASVSGFSVDQFITVQMNNGNFAQVEVLSVNTSNNTVSINIPLPSSASPPNGVTVANVA